ncbi:hypothetical protein TorRG33x02_341540, partial [Trema orientale]
MATHTQGAHGLVGEEVRVLSNPTQGAHGLAKISGNHHLGGAAARAPGGGYLAAAPPSLATMDVNITLQNPNLGLFVVETQKDGAACPLLQHAQLSTKMGNKGDLNSGNLDSSLGAAALNPGKHDLGNLNMGFSGLGNANQPGMVTEGLAHATSSSRQISSMAADKHASFTASPSYAQILNTGNNAPNENGNEAIAVPFIAPESCKPSIK